RHAPGDSPYSHGPGTAMHAGHASSISDLKLRTGGNHPREAVKRTMESLMKPELRHHGPLDIHYLVDRGVGMSNGKIKQGQIDHWLESMKDIVPDLDISTVFHRGIEFPCLSFNKSGADPDFTSIVEEIAKLILDNPDVLRTDSRTLYV